ncbi:monovalent cation/H+ antiporter complex subunit F [Micrococcus sp.]|uniref:monovalent cation/H+ antiporter complex subunit F n=1 Tax=Micrococcus sp. TaxID=1271 RepID=UPI002A913A32|nr:monovalent cation/H+ antiporter complex subunit F [Micrococcus sp.]MDY6054896.1 monovalent cation/H+ antiporter complex subunit F [Micrococcus sp.]
MIDPMMLAAWVAGALLMAGAVGALIRLVRGPSLLDRVVSSDVLLVVLSSALVLEMAVVDHTRTIMLVMITATVGFVGSVTVARFVEDRRPDHPREDRTHVATPGDQAVAPDSDARSHP